jgi:hypothetical protein
MIAGEIMCSTLARHADVPLLLEVASVALMQYRKSHLT